jgi:arginase
MESRGADSVRTYHILGVPLRSGSWTPGNEQDPQAYRDVHLLEALKAANVRASDEGDLAVPSYLPHHTVPPIRNWPGPRIVWDHLRERLMPLLQQPGHVPLLIGCDCSVIVGSAQALAQSGASNLHVVYVDGDVDDGPAAAERCQSAAYMALWLLTEPSPFREGSIVPPSNVHVVGHSKPAERPDSGIRTIPLNEVRGLGARRAAERVLSEIPAEAHVLLHFDVDVFHLREMPAMYFPHDDGLTMNEGRALFETFSRDPRMRLIEVSEYASVRDFDRSGARALTEMIVQGLTTT